MQELRRRLPQDNRNSRNIDSMVAHVLAVRESDPYIRKSFVSVESILKGRRRSGVLRCGFQEDTDQCPSQSTLQIATVFQHEELPV